LVKNNQDNQIQNITLCNVFFEKGICGVYNGAWGKAPEAGGIFENFYVKSNLIVCKLQKKWRSRMYNLFPQ